MTEGGLGSYVKTPYFRGCMGENTRVVLPEAQMWKVTDVKWRRGDKAAHVECGQSTEVDRSR